MTEFILVRHGSTENLEAGQWQGWSPVPLSRLGREQARAVAARLAEPVLDAIALMNSRIADGIWLDCWNDSSHLDASPPSPVGQSEPGRP